MVVAMPKQIDALTVADAARRLGLEIRTVQRWAKSGRLPPVHRPTRPGPGGYLFAPDTIEWAAKAAGVVAALDLANELHPGDPVGHGMDHIRSLVDDPWLEHDAGVPALRVDQIRRVAVTMPCPHSDCRTVFADDHAADDR